MAGTTITNVALPLTLVALGATTFEFGVMFAIKTCPRLVAPLFAAPLADRYRRRAVLIGCDTVRGLALATVPIAALLGVLAKPQIYAVSLVIGAGDVVALTAGRAYLPSLVRRDALVSCNGRLEAGLHFSGSVVPGFAGLLMRVIAAPLTIAIDCVSYLASIVLLRRIERVEPAPTISSVGFFAQLAEGWRAVFANRDLRVVVLSLGALNFGHAMFYAQLTPYVANDLGFDAFTVGVAVAAMSAGALVGAFVRIDRRWGTARVPAVALFVCGSGAVLQAGTGLALPAELVLLGGFLVGAGNAMFVVHNVTMRQTLAPMHLLGRVNAASITLGPGLWPVGAMVGGALGERIGLRAMFGCDAAFFAVVAVLLAVRPARASAA